MLDTINQWIMGFLNNILTEMIKQILDFFGGSFVNITSTGIDFLNLDVVQKTIVYVRTLALVLIVTKSIMDALQTYILYQNGDPDSDPNGLLMRTAQAVLIIGFVDQIVYYVFLFGNKVASDISNIGNGAINIDSKSLTDVPDNGLIMLIMFLLLCIGLLIVGIQSAIRGAEIALMAVIGPFIALNVSSQNRNLWSSYFKQLLILSLTQAVQLFMVRGFVFLFASYLSDNIGLLPVLGWLWVLIKSPKFIQQFAHSTGFTGAVAGGGKQMASNYMMRKMITK